MKYRRDNCRVAERLPILLAKETLQVGVQKTLFPMETKDAAPRHTSTFVNNMRLPVHRWFRYSAGFSAEWVRWEIARSRQQGIEPRILDPFAGSGTTLVAAEDENVPAYGIESHPFVARVAAAKLARDSNPSRLEILGAEILADARKRKGDVGKYPALIGKCYSPEALDELDRIRAATEAVLDGSETTELAWLAVACILRKTSHAGTANWQYVLPRKAKKTVARPFTAYAEQIATMCSDMQQAQVNAKATLVHDDARTTALVPTDFANLVLTSPPYPNNYDYADATRLEMCFFGDISGWGDLQDAVRQYLVRSCSQHVPQSAIDLDETLSSPYLEPIRSEIEKVCTQLAAIRLTKGGKKTYHLMVACYFLDLARIWINLRRICAPGSRVCFVIGDSAPYGIYVPVIEWLGELALAAGFASFDFEKIRDRNVKWKNRKHRVPLCEGRLWVEG